VHPKAIGPDLCARFQRSETLELFLDEAPDVAFLNLVLDRPVQEPGNRSGNQTQEYSDLEREAPVVSAAGDHEGHRSTEAAPGPQSIAVTHALVRVGAAVRAQYRIDTLLGGGVVLDSRYLSIGHLTILGNDGGCLAFNAILESFSSPQ